MLWHLFSLNKVATLIRYGNITTVAKICRSHSNLEAKHFFVIWLCFTQIQILPSKKIKPRFVLQLEIFSDNWFYLNAFIFNNIYICIVVCILMQSWRHLNDQILHTFFYTYLCNNQWQFYFSFWSALLFIRYGRWSWILCAKMWRNLWCDSKARQRSARCQTHSGTHFLSGCGVQETQSGMDYCWILVKQMQWFVSETKRFFFLQEHNIDVEAQAFPAV